MLFTSYEFLKFIFGVFLIYYLFPRQFQWFILLVSSYIFYWMVNPGCLIYILITTTSVFLLGCKIEKLRGRQFDYLKQNKEKLTKEEKKEYKNRIKKKQWRFLLICLLVNLGILAVVKYINFVIFNVNVIIRMTGRNELKFWNIALPMGISFYTFQAVGYIIDVYRGTCKAERNLFKFALFVSFFPQLVQGPISRYSNLAKTLYEEHKFDMRAVSYGLQRILWGFFKKLVVADRILTAVNSIIQNTEIYSGAYVFVGIMFYAVELYADFTGGIDITIGIAEALGISITENFNRPFFSKSIQEYWRRWHITMGTWFTDYVFYPISVCKPMLNFSKFARKYFGETIGKRLAVYLSSFAVWLATGIWHGASWNFVVWGLGNWVVIMISQELEPFYQKFHNRFHLENNRIFKAFQVSRTILLMSCIRTFDCYRDVPLTFKMFGTMFRVRNWNILWNGSLMKLGLDAADYMILLASIGLMTIISLIQRKGKVRDKIANKSYLVRFGLWYGLFLIVLIVGAYGVGYDASQFIYNQF